MSFTIHEFSTGIIADTSLDGAWSSRGFTGTWMHSTFSPAPVPACIQRAIKNGEFQAKSSSSSSEPAIIGRVVQGIGEGDWSVVAVVTRGSDESRKFRTYRFFCCAEQDNLWLIVGWLDAQRKQNQMPVFDPSSNIQRGADIDDNTALIYKKQAEEMTAWAVNISEHPEVKAWFNKELPIIVQEPKYDLKVINGLATVKGMEISRPLAWAYNIEFLERPELFLIIKPASNTAFRILDGVTSIPKVPEGIRDEVGVKSVIQELMRAEVNQRAIKFIDETLNNLEDDEETERYWHKLFDELGARDAIVEKFYNLGRMELLTLRAIILPTTLVADYLPYANLEQGVGRNLTGGANNDVQQKSLAFQSLLRNYLKGGLLNSCPQVKRHLTEGIAIALVKYFNGEVDREAVLWLLTSHQSVWQLCKESVTEEIKEILWEIYNSHEQETNQTKRKSIRAREPFLARFKNWILEKESGTE